MAERQGAYAVGIASIDALHVELEERLAALVSAGDDAHDELAALQEHLERHFAHEESLMSGTEFPMADCHAREHASVVEVVGEVQRLLAAGDRGPLGRLAPAMLEWFAVHAAGMDAALASYLKRTGSPPA
ncbi:MAG: hemerythrin family protein [Burkholderiaceae bacterium]